MFRRYGIMALLVIVPLWCYCEDSVRVIFNYNEGILKDVVDEGRVKEKRWLGVSFYPATFKDAMKEGYHLVQEINKGSFRAEFLIDNNILERYSSSYEIALWDKKVPCKNEDSYWCKTRGYTLEGLAFYQMGYFNTTWREK